MERSLRHRNKETLKKRARLVRGNTVCQRRAMFADRDGRGGAKANGGQAVDVFGS